MTLKKGDLLKLYRGLVLSRNFEEKILELYGMSKIHEMPHSGIGMEAVGIGALTFLRRDDYAMATHRGYAKQIGKGVSLKRMLAEFYGKKDGYGKGKDSHHFTAMEVNLIGKWGLIGSQFPLAVGLGMAAQVKGEGQVCVVLFGDGSSNRGTFHESLNLASVWKLPIVWVCENNGYSSTTPISRHTAAENIADYAKGYHMPGTIVDGNDVIAVHEAIQKAAKRARRGEGPSLIELITYYTKSHNEKQSEIRPPEEIKKWRRKDPVLLFRNKLMKGGVLTKKIADEIDEEVRLEIEEAVRFAEASSAPEPGMAFEDLFAEN